MAGDIIEDCEVSLGRGWQRIGIDDALRLRPERMRCPECHGRVRAHRQGTTGQRAHFEHFQTHTGCSRKPSTFSGHRSLHPDALD